MRSVLLTSPVSISRSIRERVGIREGKETAVFLEAPDESATMLAMALTIADNLACRLHGFLKFQRALSLLGSNLASVGVLPPTAVRAMGSLELGIDLGMMR